MNEKLLRRARRGDPVALTRVLVGTPSVNPELEAGGAGEEAVGRRAAGWLREWGYRVRVDELEPGRVNATARAGSGRPRLLLSGHLDTVGVERMSIPPFEAGLREGRIWGRGACDMKSGIGAILSAARHLSERDHHGELVVALTADEEYRSIGMEALVRDGIRADGAVICEPTGLSVMPAHRGFAWIEVEFRGRAAHGSRPDLGIDAIRHAGRFLAELDRYEEGLAGLPDHPLLDPPSIHAGTIRGGTVPPVYPDRCHLVLERRTLPGERAEEVLGDLRAWCGEVAGRVPDLDARLDLGFHREGGEVPVESDLVQGLLAACRTAGLAERVEGMSAWVDAGLLNEAGVPTVCFGPGSLEQAHTAREWVRIDEIEACARVLERFALRFFEGERGRSSGGG